ncbi:MAG: aldo/keto reductase [Spirochaetaceae bacterium]|nr:MAG: aldo/keto reductase [Spirochaetaceae bacterium]
MDDGKRTENLSRKQSRRQFLRTLGAGAAGAGLFSLHPAWADQEPGDDAVDSDANRPMPLRRLGRTGVEIAAFSLGGEAVVQQLQRQAEAVRIINRALDLGVNYIDTAPTYGGGGSETNIGHVMADRRSEVFLATKTHDRSYDGTMRLVEQSLRRLQTDRIDLYQIHNVRTDTDVTRALSAQGAVKALESLRSDGVIRFTGITGHRDPDVLRRAIREYPFDCLLMSLNAADIHYKPFQNELLGQALSNDMGVIAMKVTAVGRIFRDDGITSMDQALGYTLSFPVSTAIVGISSIRELEDNVRIAARSRPLPRAERAALEDLSSGYANDGNFFKHHW